MTNSWLHEHMLSGIQISNPLSAAAIERATVVPEKSAFRAFGWSYVQCRHLA
jgi:hypothetical protein